MKCNLKKYFSNILKNDIPIKSWDGDILDALEEFERVNRITNVEDMVKKPLPISSNNKNKIKPVQKKHEVLIEKNNLIGQNDKTNNDLSYDLKFAHILRKYSALSWTGAWSVKLFNKCPRAGFFRSTGLRKKISYNSDFALKIGIMIHEYVLADEFTPEANKKLINEYHQAFKDDENQLAYDITSIVLKAREKLFESIHKKLKSDYITRFEEEYKYKVKGIDVIQFVDCYSFKINRKKRGNTIDCYIYDLKTSKHKNTDPKKYLGQLVYYSTNIRKKLSNEFSIDPSKIKIKCFILWAVYCPITVMFKGRDEGRVIKAPAPFSTVEQQQKCLPNLTKINNRHLFPPVTILSITTGGYSFKSIDNSMTPIPQDESLIRLTPVAIEIEKEVSMDHKINQSTEIIMNGKVPQNRDFCTKDYGCDYISICNGKNTINPDHFNFKKHTIKILNDNMNMLSKIDNSLD